MVAVSKTHVPPSLAAHDLTKTFGSTKVLTAFNLEIPAGSVHALVGHNGSGKSTFVKILSGYHSPDPVGGQVLVGGSELEFGNPRSSAKAGLSFVHQALGLVADLTVQENLHLGTSWAATRLGRIRWKEDIRRSAESLESLDVRVSPRTYVRDLSAAERTQVAIVRALVCTEDIKTLVLDEATAALPDTEVAQLFETIRNVTSRGVGVLYITHRLEEIAQIADEVTVLENGRTIAQRPTAGLATADLIRYIAEPTAHGAGSETAPHHPSGGELPVSATSADDNPVLSLVDVSTTVVKRLSLDIQPGEILGITGLIGAGPTDLIRMLSGMTAASGEILVGGRSIAVTKTHELAASRTALVVGERTDRVIQNLTVMENATLSIIGDFFRRLALRSRRERRAASAAVASFEIRAPGLSAQARLLSGGNQQKLALARALLTQPVLLILEEPFHGVDAKGRLDIGQLLRRAADSGTAILTIDTDVDALVGLCDRVLVMRDGLVTASVRGPEVTRQNLLKATHGDWGISA